MELISPGRARRDTARSRTLIAGLTAVAACAALVAGCGGSKGGGRALPAAASTTPTTPVRVVTTTTTVPFLTYRVQRGDTLTRIAAQYRVSAASIVALNHVANPDQLAEGRTLRIPPAPPLALVVTPSRGPQGQAFRLTLTGAPPSAQVVFEVHSPRATFTGPPHVAAADGTVRATYRTGPTDPTGTFIAVAKANGAPVGRVTFVLTAATPVT